jgi:hypothetical protein
MAADYATLADLKLHWSKLLAEDESQATQKLHEASVEIRGNYPDIDARLSISVEDGGMDPDIPKLVATRMVKRAMDVSEDTPTVGFESMQFGTGPFSMGGKVHNPDGNIYLSAADKRLLAKSRRRKQAWTIQPGG